MIQSRHKLLRVLEDGQVMPLGASQAAVAVVARVVEKDPYACQRRTLADVFRVVVIVAPGVDQHGDPQHCATLDSGLPAPVPVVSSQVEDEKHGTIGGAATFLVDVVSTEIDDRVDIGHGVKGVGVVAVAAHEDRDPGVVEAPFDLTGDAGDGGKAGILPIHSGQGCQQ